MSHPGLRVRNGSWRWEARGGGEAGGRGEAGGLFKEPACREHPQAGIPALSWRQWAAPALSSASPNSDHAQIA